MEDSVFEDKEKYPVNVMVWGAIGPGFRSPLIFCDNSVSSSEYIEILKEARLFERADERYDGVYIFQQDGATPHTAAKTRDWITARANLLNHWPPNSPDLNPIEHVWAFLKRSLRHLNPRTKEELKQCLTILWDTMAQDYLDRLSQSLRYRFYLTLMHGGGSISRLMREGHVFEPLVFPCPGDVVPYADMVLGPEPEFFGEEPV